jgi:hypothetical protein
MFDVTAIVNYRFSCANHEKQTSVLRFHLQQTNRSLPFRFSVCSKQIEVADSVSFIFRMYTYASVSIHIYIYTAYGKRNYIFKYMLPLQRKNGSSGDFP